MLTVPLDALADNRESGLTRFGIGSQEKSSERNERNEARNGLALAISGPLIHLKPRIFQPATQVRFY
jgi:hypothetical protein